VRVVGHQDDGDAQFRVDPLEDGHDFLAGPRVEVAGGLVGQDEARVAGDGPGDGHALLLAPGKLGGAVGEAVAHADDLEGLPGLASPLPQREAAVDERQFHVLLGRRPGEEVEGLEDEADLAVPDGGEFVAGEGRDVTAFDEVGARGRPVEAADDVHEGRLAGAGRAHDAEELTRADAQIDTPQGRHRKAGFPVEFADPRELEQGLHRPPPDSLPGLCCPGGAKRLLFVARLPVTTVSPSLRPERISV